MRRLSFALATLFVATASFVTLACSSPEGSSGSDNDDDSSGTAGGNGVVDPNANADGDCLTDAEEAVLGTDPNAIDSDLDGVSDCDEIACVSDPILGTEQCYTCGWKHNDPGTFVSTGDGTGYVVANMIMTDQCEEPVELWDFAQEYHILYQTAAW